MVKNKQLIKMLIMEIICKLEMMDELCDHGKNTGSSIQYEISIASYAMRKILEMMRIENETA